MIRNVLAGVAVSLFACSPRSSEMPEERSYEVERIERYLDLRWPCEIVRLDLYADGGSLGGSLRDADGRKLEFCWDGRVRKFHFTPHEHRLAYLGADYVEKSSAVPVLVGSPAESALVDVLTLAAEQSIPSADHDSLVAALDDDSSSPNTWRAAWSRVHGARREIASRPDGYLQLAGYGTHPSLKRSRLFGWPPCSESNAPGVACHESSLQWLE